MNEALQYFQHERGYHTLFKLIRKKYESLGRFGGTISITLLSEEEINRLALFMGISPHHIVEKGRLMISDFEKRLKNTRFADVSLHTLLEAYFGEEIQSRKTRDELRIAKQMDKLAEFKQLYPHIERWFSYLEGGSIDTHWILRLLFEPDFDKHVRLLATAYASLPNEYERYPLFSQRVSGNPHALDLGTVRGNLWIHLLHIMAGGEGAPPAQAESVNELLLLYYLLRDDIQNFVTQANLLAYIGDREHPVWRTAADEQNVLNVPIRELIKVEKVKTVLGNSKVYIVENSGIFSALLDEVPDAPLICTHGQFKLAGLRLMDLLEESGYTLYYSGDFDPEGLSMALRFKERYGEHGQLWRMTVDDYKTSNPVVELGERDVKLDSLIESELGNVALAIREHGKMGYQEGIINLLIRDLQSRT